MSILTSNLLKRILDISDKSLTSNEISVIILLAKIQDDIGHCYGVYWKHVAAYASISKSGYYQVVKELELKKFIKIIESQNRCMNIYVIDNNVESLITKEVQCSINLNHFIFDDKEFYKLKANEKRLILYIIVDYMNNDVFNKINNVNEFYIKYAKLLGTKERSINKYFINIQKWVKIKNKNSISCSSILEERKDNIEFIVKKDNEIIYREKIDNERLNQIIESKENSNHEKIIEILL